MENFEQRAIATSAYKSRIWRRYVDNTFTTLDRGNVDSFLQYLNNQQPSIRFTMETENDYKFADKSSSFLLLQFIAKLYFIQ